MYSKKDNFPLVSVVIPVFNGDKIIEDTVRNVFTQTYPNIEVVIVNDCSTDTTYDVLERLKISFDRLTVINLDTNSGGPALPRNIGVSHARGVYIAFLDYDDLWHIRKLELQVAYLIASGEGAVCSVCRNFIRKDFSCDEALDNGNVKRITYTMTLKKSLIPLSTFVIKKDLALKYSFDSDKEIIGREDYLYTLDFLRDNEYVTKMSHILMYYRVHANQISKNKFSMLKKQFHVLWRHLSGKGCIYKIIFIFECMFFHVALSIYYRVLLRKF